MMGFDGGQQQKTTLFPNRNHWLQCSGLLWWAQAVVMGKVTRPRRQPWEKHWDLREVSVWRVLIRGREKGSTPNVIVT